MVLVDNEEKFEYECMGTDGPVPPDILLNLCKSGDVDIVDIFISDITERYIEFVSSMQETDYEQISIFLTYASKLLELKSNNLIPQTNYEEYEEEDLSAENDRFMMNLNEYKILSDAAAKLGDTEQLNRFYRAPMYGKDDYELIMKNFSIDRMIGTFSSLLESFEYDDYVEEPRTIEKERFTVAERISELVESVRAFKKLRFYEMFRPDFGKIEVINTFLALLEMLKQQIITVEQKEAGGDISITYREEFDNLNEEAREELFKDVEEYN
ncbi:MAG: segregation/condensation protein A [Bacillota bacterium]